MKRPREREKGREEPALRVMSDQGKLAHFEFCLLRPMIRSLFPCKKKFFLTKNNNNDNNNILVKSKDN